MMSHLIILKCFVLFILFICVIYIYICVVSMDLCVLNKKKKEKLTTHLNRVTRTVISASARSSNGKRSGCKLTRADAFTH